MADVIKFFSAAEIVAINDRSIVPIFVPEWGGTIGAKPMDAFKAKQWREQNKVEGAESYLTLFINCTCDEKGNGLFTPDEIEELRKKNIGVFMRVQKKLMQMNGFTQPDRTWATVKGLLEKHEASPELIKKMKADWEQLDELGDAVKNS